jgi:hypothetical protein
MGKGSSGNQSYQVFQANEPVAVEQSLNEREPYVRGYTLIATVQAKNLSGAVEKSNSRDGNGWVNRKPQALGVGERETGRGDVIVDSRGQSYRYDGLNDFTKLRASDLPPVSPAVAAEGQDTPSRQEHRDNRQIRQQQASSPSRSIDLNQKSATTSRLDMRASDLRNSNYAGLSFEGADLRGSDLSGSNFTGANFRYADMRGVIMHGTVFENANMYGAKMQGVEAFDANFRGADMRQTNLAGAYLTGAAMPPPSPADLMEQNAASWQQEKKQEVSPADLKERPQSGQQQHNGQKQSQRNGHRM